MYKFTEEQLMIRDMVRELTAKEIEPRDRDMDENGFDFDLIPILTEAGLRFQIIDPSSKTRYHLAAVYASNLVCGLIGEASRLLQECGFGEEDALNALSPLIAGNVEHALAVGPVRALTGPVERGDVITLEKHLSVCESEEDRQLYLLLSEKLLRLAKEKHPERDYEEMEQFLRRRQHEHLQK